MATDGSATRLVGNAAGGVLGSIFPFDMTVATATCDGCGARGQVASLTLYADAPGIVLIVSGLGFLGLGLPPPAPEWGAMVAEGRAIVFEAWWVSTLPGLMILMLSLGFNFLGDALRDVVEKK